MNGVMDLTNVMGLTIFGEMYYGLFGYKLQFVSWDRIIIHK